MRRWCSFWTKYRRECGFELSSGFRRFDHFFLREHAVEECVSVHLDLLVNVGWAVVGGEVAECF